MNARLERRFQHVAHYGQTSLESHEFTGRVPASFTFNSPVGLCMDRHQQVWVCDTGNNRVVVLDRSLTHILRILHCPDPGGAGQAGLDFRMPFHVCPHPEMDRVYISDMGNSRIVAMDYAAGRFTFAFAFGNQKGAGFDPLQDPNGLTVVANQAGGGYSIYVNDEFFHTPTEPIRNRCVRFDEKGDYVEDFRTLIDPDGSRHDLYWPQGLSSDAKGNLYIANTGSYEILKCAAGEPIGPDYSVTAKAPLISHQFEQPTGIGMLNIMRDVNVIGDHVFVPDHVANTISVYTLDGRELSPIKGVRPAWNHGAEPVHSLTDRLYYTLEDEALVSPYVICQGETADTFLVSEPFTSRIIKLRIDRLGDPDSQASLIMAVGGRRDEPGSRGRDPQFNCVTSVLGLQRRTPNGAAPAADSAAELPDYLRYNPFQLGYMSLGKALAAQYDFWFGDWTRRLLSTARATDAAGSFRLNVDAGNWQFKGYREDDRRFKAVHSPASGYFLPGNLAMAVYHPRAPLLGQICPGTPIVLVGNFNLGMVSMYQLDPLGRLINYGLPFGIQGEADGCLSGPQGMVVSDDGEVFIVDALNNRMSKWQFLQTGQVVFIRNFVWQGKGEGTGEQSIFTPTDVALDAHNRLFVTDQFNNRICVFDRYGNSLWCYGRQGYWEEGEADGGKFMLPTSLSIDGEHLILNDLVNRALKIFRIGPDALQFEGGISLFKLSQDKGGVWMPYFMHAQDGQVSVADSTYNIVQVFEY